jgi:transcriptional regulator with XRE-family HTH domain
MNIASRVGSTIRELRELRGWTQAELADRTGIPYGTIKHYEQASHAPPIKRLREIGKAFDADAASLLKDAGL